MAVAFKRLRPLFRERGKINAEVTGRLGEALGGVRIVKSYTAEKREDLVFTRGAHRLFRNVARSITGVSAITAFSTVVIGAIGVLMIVVGGRAILAGTMTLGDFVMYLFFTGLVAAPLVQIASIGTQISEAFAGLDRIREMRSMATEDEQDASRLRGRAVAAATSRSRTCGFEYTPGRAGAAGRLVPCAGRFDDRAGGVERVGEEHADQPRDGVQPAEVRARPRGRRATWPTSACATTAAHLGVVLQENFLFDGTIAENIAYARPDATPRRDRGGQRASRTATTFIQEFPDKYDTVVGERGVKLSGGQRQRVAIARAILADPRILDPGRGHVEPRQRERGADPGRPAVAAAGPDHVRHRPPPVHDPERGPDPGSRGRADRGARDARGAAGRGRALPPAPRQAVPARAGSLRQPRRGVHAGRWE